MLAAGVEEGVVLVLAVEVAAVWLGLEVLKAKMLSIKI